MFWQTQRVMQRAPGTPGVVVLLADRSTSMSYAALRETAEAIPHFAREIPGLRAFMFHAGLAEANLRAAQSLCHAFPSMGAHKSGGRYRNSTYLGACLESIAALKPSKTIVLSDGGVADMKRALRAADQMTGDIDAYFCRANNRDWEDEGFMRDLARRGRGAFVTIQTGTGDIRQVLGQSLIHLLTRIHVHHLPPLHVHHRG